LEKKAVSTTRIEKENLEAHVELCAERYDALETKLDTVEEKVSSLETSVGEIKDMITHLDRRRSTQLITWAGTAITMLIGVVGWLLTKFVW
jgi:chromosome segregation ATPase